MKLTKGEIFEIQNRNLFKISFPTFLKHHSKRYRTQIPKARRKTSYLKYIHQRLRFIMSVNFDQCMFISSLFSSTHICIERFWFILDIFISLHSFSLWQQIVFFFWTKCDFALFCRCFLLGYSLVGLWFSFLWELNPMLCLSFYTNDDWCGLSLWWVCQELDYVLYVVLKLLFITKTLIIWVFSSSN